MDPLSSPATYPLLDLQLRVARRADQLSRTRVNGSLLNLHCWLLAEQELLGDALSDTPHADKFRKHSPPWLYRAARG